MSENFDIINSAIGGAIGAIGGTAVIVAALSFLSGKIVEYFLNTQFEKHKKIFELNSERMKLSFNLELEVLKELWDYIQNIVDKGSRFDRSSSQCVAEWDKLIEDFKRFLFRKNPYMHSSISELTNQLIEITNQDGFDVSQFNRLEKIKDLIIDKYQERLFLR